MWLRHWREFLPGHESTFDKHERRYAELNRTYPFPQARPSPPAPDAGTTD